MRPSREEPAVDPVLKVLIDLGLTDQEAIFRGALQNVSTSPDVPSRRDLAIALIATLMGRSGQPWPHILCAMNALKARTPEQLQSGDVVAIVNGDRLILPGKEDRDIRQFDLFTMREVREMDSPAIVTTIFSLAGAWAMLDRSLGT